MEEEAESPKKKSRNCAAGESAGSNYSAETSQQSDTANPQTLGSLLNEAQPPILIDIVAKHFKENIIEDLSKAEGNCANWNADQIVQYEGGKFTVKELLGFAYRVGGIPTVSNKPKLVSVPAGSYRVYQQDRDNACWKYVHNAKVNAVSDRISGLNLRNNSLENNAFVVRHTVGVADDKCLVDRTLVQLHQDTIFLVENHFPTPSHQI